MPFSYLVEGRLRLFIKEKINPEISFNSFELDSFKKDDFRKIAEELIAADLSITLHAPFMDLRPGAIDPRIRQAGLERFRQLMEIAPVFRPKSIVFHPCFDRRYYVSSERQWLENSLSTWRELLPFAEQMDTVIALENVYETEPGVLKKLIDALNSKRVRLCFDTGHFNVFARTPLRQWVDELGTRIGRLHVHDNHGRYDEHLPPGEGTFPFRDFFSMLRQFELQPPITVEPHSEEHVWRTMENIRRLELLNYLDERMEKKV